jgi:nucleoside-diphosphate-sugar epimerase
MANKIIRVGVSGISGTVGFAFCSNLRFNRNYQIQALHREPRSKDAEQLQRLCAVHQNFTGINNINLISNANNEFNIDALEKSVNETDAFIHLAAYSRRKIPDDQAGEVLKTNVLWTAVLSRMALKAKAKRFIYASTTLIYDCFVPKNLCKTGAEEKEGLSENVALDMAAYKDWLAKVTPLINQYSSEMTRNEKVDDPSAFIAALLAQYPIPNGTRDLYPLSKYMGEQIVSGLWDNGIEGINLRFSPIFGPSPVDSPTRVIPFIISLINSGKELTAMPWSTCMIYLNDVITAINNAVMNPITRENSTIHLGPHLKRYPQIEVIRHLLKAAGKQEPIKLIEAPQRCDNMLDTSRAQQELILPETPIEEALKDTYEYFIGNRLGKK